MGHIVINSGPVLGAEVPIQPDAADVVRMSFNPGGLEDVNRLKAIAAAFVSEARRVGAGVKDPRAAREVALAVTHMQTASMFAVAAATADL